MMIRILFSMKNDCLSLKQTNSEQMKYLSIMVLVVLAIGCKKSKFKKYTVGSEHNMVVTQRDIVLEAPKTSDGIETSSIDLDDDGELDLAFNIDRIDSEDIDWQYQIDFTMERLNSNTEIVENKNSNILYASVGEFLDESGFGPPKFIQTTRISRDASSYDYQITRSNTPVSFDVISELDYDAQEWGNAGDHLSLALTNTTEDVYAFNETGDALYGYRKIVEADCNGLQVDQRTYFVYRIIIDDDCYKVGWIELLRTADYKLHITRTAISEKGIKL